MARTNPTRFGHGNHGDALVFPGTVIHQFSGAEANQFASNWLATFCAHGQEINTRAFLWHVFSADCYPCKRGTVAIEAYKRQSGVEFVVLSNDRTLAFLTDMLPESSSLSDYYVFPPNLAWTMAFTHEDGWLGPYFAQHPDYVRLNQINQSNIRKVREVEKAKRNGWV
jgi:hypothetical protein